jgi:hypothetical protein
MGTEDGIQPRLFSRWLIHESLQVLKEHGRQMTIVKWAQTIALTVVNKLKTLDCYYLPTGAAIEPSIISCLDFRQNCYSVMIRDVLEFHPIVSKHANPRRRGRAV